MGRDLAIDLGTANTLVYREGRGIVLDEPAVVAVSGVEGAVVAVGDDAWAAVDGPSGSLLAVRPLRHGTMREFEMTQRMLAAVLRKVGASRFPRPRVLVAVPSQSTAVERRAIEEVVERAGAREVTLVEEPLAAAIGAGLPVHEAIGNLIVDIGGGRSEMAVVSMGGVVSGTSVNLGGFDLDTAIQAQLKESFGVAIGEKAAEELKMAIGSALPGPKTRKALVVGRELATGSTAEVEVREDELREAMSPTVGGIVEAARRSLAEAPPELTHDVLETGMFLTGGGSLLRGLDLLLAKECEVPVHPTERPLETVALGAGHMLEHLAEYRSAFQLVRRRVSS
jgi:rod shape-determining protein MreB